MKVVLDANIFISAFFWGGNPRAVLKRIIESQDELFISKEILDEIELVVRRPKFHAGKDQIDFFIDSIEEIGRKVAPKSHMRAGSRARADNKYIECGMAAKAQYIIFGDIHLLEMKKYGLIKIVSPGEYLQLF